MILNHVTTNPVTEGRNKHIDIKWHGPYLGLVSALDQLFLYILITLVLKYSF